MLTTVLVCFRVMQTAAYIALFLILLLELKEPKKQQYVKAIVVFIGVTISFMLIYILYGERTARGATIPFEVFLGLYIMFRCSSDSLQVSMFVMFIQFDFMLAINWIADVLCGCLGGTESGLFYLLIRLILFGLTLYIMVRCIRPRFRRVVEIIEDGWMLFTIVAFLFYILESVIQYYPNGYWHDDNYRVFLVLSSYLVFVGVCVLLFQSTVMLAEKYEWREREQILTQGNKQWEELLKREKSAIEVTRRERHDMHHHFDAIAGLIADNKLEEALFYLQKKSQSLENRNVIAICEHPTANVVLSHWMQQAELAGINLKTDVKIPKNIPIEAVSLATILANACENAWNACLKIKNAEERFIELSIQYIREGDYEKICILLSNSYSGEITFKNGLPESGRPGRGVGTKSILYNVEKYNGITEFTAENSIFKMRIMFRFLHADSLEKTIVAEVDALDI